MYCNQKQNKIMTVKVNTPVSTVIYVILVILKLANVISWSWWVVNIPLYVIGIVGMYAYFYYVNPNNTKSLTIHI